MTAKHITTILISIITLVSSVMAQDDSFTRLKNYARNIVAFGRQNPQEKVFLHFDNKAYYIGETIWFSAYIVDAGSLLPTARSRVLYVELLSPDGDIITSKKLKTVNGRCYGELVILGRNETFSEGFSNNINIINNLHSGFYEVRAYTREMQNFGEGCYFSRVFPIYDAPAIDGDYSQMQFTENKTKRSAKTRKTEPDGDDINIEFYPEGGTLIEGIESRIAFRVTDKNGMPADIDGIIKEDGTKIRTIHEGMGCFKHIPKKNRSSITITYNNKAYKFNLPNAEKTGYSMTVENNRNDSIYVNVIRNTNTLQTIGVTLMCRENPVYFDTLHWNGNNAKLSISKEKANAGVHQLTLFNKEGAILSERLLFIKNNMPSNMQMEITSDKYFYAPYEKAKVQIKTTQDNTPISTYLSLSVRDGDIENGNHYNDDICTNLLLSSDLKGYIANPQYYFENDDEEHDTALDLLMMVQGWRRYEWQRMAGLKTFDITNYSEDGITIDGEVFALSHDKPLEGIKVIMRAFSPDGKYVQSNSVTTDSKGEFNFKLADFYGKWKLVLFLAKENSRLKKNARIKINRAPMSQNRPYYRWETNIPKPIIHNREYAKTISEATKVEDFFILPGITIKKNENYLECEAFYIKEDCEILYDKGEIPGNINEYLLEKMPQWIEENHITNILSYKNIPITFIAMRPKGSLWESAIPSHYAGTIDLEEVDHILFFHNPFAYQNLRLSLKDMHPNSPLHDLETYAKNDKKYIALIYPKKNNEVTYETKGMRATYIEGYSVVKEFFSPDYNNAPLPGETDYRRTLYWNPLLRTDSTGIAEIEFYNNSRCRIMEMDAATITPKGVIGCGKKRLTIQNQDK